MSNAEIVPSQTPPSTPKTPSGHLLLRFAPLRGRTGLLFAWVLLISVRSAPSAVHGCFRRPVVAFEPVLDTYILKRLETYKTDDRPNRQNPNTDNPSM